MMLLRLELSLGLTGALSVGATPGRVLVVLGTSDEDGRACGSSCGGALVGSSERGGACAQSANDRQSRSKYDQRIPSILVQSASG